MYKLITVFLFMLFSTQFSSAAIKANCNGLALSSSSCKSIFQNYLTGAPVKVSSKTANLDLNGDGQITAGDATLCYNITVGKTTLSEIDGFKNLKCTISVN